MRVWFKRVFGDVVVQLLTAAIIAGGAFVGTIIYHRVMSEHPRPDRQEKPNNGIVKSFKDCKDICPEMAVIAAGDFTMGSPKDEFKQESWQKDAEYPPHKVNIPKSIAVGIYPITVKEFLYFTEKEKYESKGQCYIPSGSIPHNSFQHPGFNNLGLHPAVCVSWHDAQAYAAWLRRETGKRYRLPSEAEREYFTRAGTNKPFWFGNSISPDNANYNSTVSYRGGKTANPVGETVPVQKFAPNKWGLYQVHGNVSEWVQDCWHQGYDSKPEILKLTGKAWEEKDCPLRVYKGGSWADTPSYLRSAYRYRSDPRLRDSTIGFRVVRDID